MPSKPTVKAYRGDAKTLVAFNLPQPSTTNLAGFTIHYQPAGQPGHYLSNSLQFETPSQHAQDANEPPSSSINAPFHRFRWLHVPGSVHQGTRPFYGDYTYTVTPRYFDASGSLLPLDPALSAAVQVAVGPFKKQGLELGFTRGFTQSQAFVRHFGLKAPIRPKGKALLFSTSQQAGVNPAGQTFTFADEYEWLGFTARAKILALLDDVLAAPTRRVDVFAYDLNEPDVVDRLVKLGQQGRVRIILDNAPLHHASPPKPEDQFEKLFAGAAQAPAAIRRGKFGRFAHDKIFVVYEHDQAVKVLTGSTNFSVTGLYVNSNHVLVFNDPQVAARYAQVFEAAWNGKVKQGAFLKSGLAAVSFPFCGPQTPQTEATFSPHPPAFADVVLKGLTDRIKKESTTPGGSVFFAVMEMKTGSGPVFPALQQLHGNQQIYSYGISDSSDGIYIYTPGKANGVLATGKPVGTRLPPPFNQVPGVGLGHQIHHKFVVCGFNGKDPVVYCGSSNLAGKGELVNGDNLLAIHDSEVATAFALEALGLVDHFDFLDRCATGKAKAKKAAVADKSQAAVARKWHLSTDDKWARPYYAPGDLHCVDRLLFG
jgi:phosphatidylserine/phosphatidylglycerophosphate/cardiolipin synthase-like enzyme